MVKQKPNAQSKHRILKGIGITLLAILAVPLFLVQTVVILSYAYTPFQKPVHVNQNTVLENKLNIPSLLQPRIENGEKVFDLSAQQGETQILPGKPTKTLGFNGNILGPTVRAHTGDKVRMNVTNKLNEPTTVHWHGMHLPAAMDGGPHQAIAAGQNWQPYWTIENEASTLWYHPHLMGKTGEHTYRGLAGMFIIDDANADNLDLPKEYGVDDLPLIVQDRVFDANNQLVYDADKEDALGHPGALGDKILVNGTYAPYAEVPAKQVRLRVANASNARRFNFGFADKRTFYQIASDGGLLEAPVARTEMILAPGERAEIVVDLTGQTQPITLMSGPVHEEVRPLRFIRHILRVDRDENQVFKILELRPQATMAIAHPLPQKLNTIERLTAGQAVKTRKFMFNPGSKTINDRSMDPMRIDEVVHTGDIEIWQVTNRTGSYHPFHIHDVQFQILSRGGEPPADYERGWKDTVLIENAETVRLIMRFPEFSDPHLPYMYHCHILEHEDMGMMAQFVVVNKDVKAEDIFIQGSQAEMDHSSMH